MQSTDEEKQLREKARKAKWYKANKPKIIANREANKESIAAYRAKQRSRK